PTKSNSQIGPIRSPVHDRDGNSFVFSRDCPEYTIKTPSGERLILLLNHLKSKGYGSQSVSNARRELQARRIGQIYDELRAAGEKNVAVVGDFNDYPESAPLRPLVAETDLR